MEATTEHLISGRSDAAGEGGDGRAGKHMHLWMRVQDRFCKRQTRQLITGGEEEEGEAEGRGSFCVVVRLTSLFPCH